MQFLALIALALLLSHPAGAAGAADGASETAQAEAEADLAPVVIDGVELFRVRGFSAWPAAKRAVRITARIEALAADARFRTDDLRIAESEFGTDVLGGKQRVLTVTDADARIEGVDRKEIARKYHSLTVQAIDEYRQARTREALTGAAIRGAAATAVISAIVALVIWLSQRTYAVLGGRYEQRIQSVGIQSFQIVRAERIWRALKGMLTTAYAAVLLVPAFMYLDYILGLFPWTRAFGAQLWAFVVSPLEYLGRGIVDAIPDLVFLAILAVIARYLLKAIHALFAAIGRGDVKLTGFDAEWAAPTYKLVRVLVIILALVVAYPYIPGSSSDAFKGISIFVGVLFSLGSSSAMANLIAGYMMTYRRAFKLGDRVRIGNAVGDVIERRLQATHLRTTKNEEVVIPNSVILNNDVVNYSARARKEGLILHTTVGIGYETAWRQVEAMLLMAAARTPGLRSESVPFVRLKSLGDFAVSYELNIHCDSAQAMELAYTELHRNILDVFNEYGVQIMTPAYEGDPAQPKVVPKKQWFSAPANDLRS